ncbi:glycine oxidase ThiO [Paenibacillus hexagrammi]|uniref:glycine oxidase n=1 Tax=Paenibacillus hexagrammi TaxID=2908839 RepID=A0ABY3SJ95_9BACL|nr:glycine oxidase ThiO [Paenibacillus sp. YPD9-1]UJF34117.1 glycine oxidase ThiO [Paenibacillus sp. YPD9-1]
MYNKQMHEVIVVGGGVIGCSIAYELAKKGQRVILLERGRIGQEATQAAAGMLGAQSEMEDVGPLFQWSRISRSLFPRLSEELKEVTGIDMGLNREGLLHIALNDEQRHELIRRERLHSSVRARAEWLSAKEAAQLEPQLGEDLLGALYLPDDGQVDAPLLGQALAKAASIRGVELREYMQVLGLLTEGEKVLGVMTSDGPIYGNQVIVAAGTWSSQLLSGIGVELPMYPVKGECFSVLERSPRLRKTLFTHGCYIVPKAGGRLVVGATMVPGSYDRKVTVAGLAQLMERAAGLVPSIAEAEWEKAWTGLRPQTADGLPYIGAIPGIEGLYAATGHYRNGILLSPITGRVMADLVSGGSGAEIFSSDEQAAQKETILGGSGGRDGAESRHGSTGDRAEAESRHEGSEDRAVMESRHGGTGERVGAGSGHEWSGDQAGTEATMEVWKAFCPSRRLVTDQLLGEKRHSEKELITIEIAH